MCTYTYVSQTDCDDPLLFIGKHILHHATKYNLRETDNKLEVKT